jgi:2-hydroxychromene-2-carboxylate isomerase
VTPEDVAQIGAAIGIDRNELAAGISRPDVKERLRSEVDLAIERGVFGSPFVFADGEPFWGNDRLEDVREWLRRGW